MSEGPVFYISRPDQEPAGPYDLAQIAELFRDGKISAQTGVRTESGDGWKPLVLLPEFEAIQKLCPEKVAESPEETIEGAEVSAAPSKVQGYIRGGVVATLVCNGAFTLAIFDAHHARYVAYAGVGVALAGAILMLVWFWRRGRWSEGLISLVPFYDVFHFYREMGNHAAFLCVKYGGLAVALMTLIGLRLSSLD